VAQKTQPAKPKKGATSLLSLQASGFAVTILALLVAGVVILAPSLRVLAEQQQEIAELREALAQAQQDVVDLAEQRERWSDPAFVETQARERLMFVYPGDITYLVIDDIDDEDDADQTPISTDIVQAGTDWRRALLGSYLVAATTSRSSERKFDSDPPTLPAPQVGQ
jgi:cell division protein FtsB